MGPESACLTRSFSHPSDSSREAHEGDPIRALRQSVSFGRFMSEPLDWEKWSSFSHNRYLEEAEKISKPGSVAAKKAYFESQYKPIAAKKDTAVLEKANSSTFTSETDTAEEMHDNAATDITQDIDICNSTSANVCNPDFARYDIDNAMVEETKFVTHEGVIAVDCSHSGILEQCESVETHNKLVKCKEKDSLHKTTSSKRPGVCSLKLAAPVPQRKGDNGNTSSKKCARESVNRIRTTPKAIHMSISFASCAGETIKTSPHLKTIGNSRVLTTSVKTSTNSSTDVPTIQAPIKKVSKDSSVIPRSENKSHLRSSGLKSRSSTICSPFRFRSEERVEKSKEFFKSLEENARRETENLQLHFKSKEKADRDLKKLWQSIEIKPKPVADFDSETDQPVNRMKVSRFTSYRPPRKPSATADDTKHIIGQH